MEARGSISDFNWQSRAHPCEHTHKSADALQLELKDLEKKQPPTFCSWPFQLCHHSLLHGG